LELYPSEADLRGAFQVIRKARVPHVPDVLSEIRTEIGRREPDIKRVADLVAQDPALAGSVLKTVNSARLGGVEQIENIHHACVRLGLQALTNLVTAELVGILAEDAGPDVREAWETSLETAKAAMVIAEHVQGVSMDEAYLMGIMHDVGNILFARIRSGLGDLREQAYVTPVSGIDVERRRLGTDHPTVGFMFARHWELPEPLALAIYHHHQATCAAIEDPHVRCLTAISKLADYLVSRHLRDIELPEMVQYRMAARRELLLSDEAWDEIAQDVGNAYAEVS